MTSSIPKRPVLTRALKRLVLNNPSTLVSMDAQTRLQLESFKNNKVPSVVGSPLTSSSSRTSLGLIAEQRKQLESTHWIQCDNELCMKWRRVTEAEVNGVTDKSKWFCSMNKDEKCKSCDAPEENTQWYDKAAKKLGLCYIKSAFTEGMLVLAKFPGYVKWPAVITRDPDNSLFVTFTSPSEPYTYHVEFLGKTHSHGWVKASSVDKFGKAVLEYEQVKTENNSQLKRRRGMHKKLQMQKEAKQMYRGNKTVQYAIKEAERLQPMSVSERLAKCIFLSKSEASLSTREPTEISECKSIRETSKCKYYFNLRSTRSKSAEISKLNKLKENIGDGDGNAANLVHQMNSMQSRELRNQTEITRCLRSDMSAQHRNAESPEIQHLNFNDADGNNVQLNFSSNLLLDHSKEEKFVLDIEMYKRNEKAFDHDVYRFLKRNNIKICRLPIWNKTSVSLFQLFLAVHERGGYKKVCINRSWTAVFREVTDASIGSGGSAKNFYKKYLYPYERYVKGKDYSKQIKLAKPKIMKKKFNSKEHHTTASDVNQHTAEYVPTENEDCLFSELNDPESEQSVDLAELLENLEQECVPSYLEEDVLLGQNKLGIDITFCDESPVRNQTSNIIEADIISEFGTTLQQDTEAQVPDISIFSSINEDKFLYEMQALQKELYEQIEFL